MYAWDYRSLRTAPLVQVSVLMPAPYCFDYYSFIMQFEIRKRHTSDVVFSQGGLNYPGSFEISTNFKMDFFPCLFANHYGNFDRNHIENIDHFGLGFILQIRSNRRAFHLFGFFLVSLIMSCSFQCKDIFPPWLNVFLSILFFLMLLSMKFP